MSTATIVLDLATVKYTVELLPCDIPIRGSFDTGDADEDARTCENIERDLQAGNVWAWCTLRCTATCGSFKGTDYLGAVSAASEQDAYEQAAAHGMQAEALADLKRRIVAMGGTIAEES